MKPDRAAAVRWLPVAAGLLLLLLHFGNLVFDLPPGAANLSPFDVGVFAIDAVKFRSPAAIAADPEWRRLGLGLLLAAAAWGAVRWLPGPAAAAGRMWDRLLDFPERPFLAAVAAGQFILSAGISLFVFSAMPHVQDEIGQCFQAKIFASGALYAAPFRFPDFFSFYSVIHAEKWYSQHPPGFPLLLAPFMRAGIPWLLNPLLGTGCTLLVHRMARRLFGERTARLAALLMLLSPFHAFMSGSFMNHTATLFMLLLAGTFLLESPAGAGRAAAAGFALGMAAITRPLTALAMGGVLAAVLALAPGARDRARIAAALLAGFAVPAAFLLWFNHRLNGGPFTMGYTIADPAFHRLGFAGLPVAYSPVKAWIKTGQLIRGLDLHLFAWPVPSLLPIWILLLSRRMGRREWFTLAAALSVPFAYFFYWFQDMCLGPRFAYESSAFLAILAARAVAGWSGAANRAPGRARWLPVFALLCLGWSLAFSWPPLARGYSGSYWGTGPELTRRVEEAGLKNAVVVAGEEGCPWNYGSGFWANDPGLKGEVVYARDLGDDATRVLSALMPRRAVFRYDCRTDTLTPWTPPAGSPDGAP